MSCIAPLKAWRGRNIDPATGLRPLVFSRRDAYTEESISIPCGQCIACRFEKARQWSMRCLHESRLHNANEFITLTYDNEHLPPFGTLVKRDLQLFMKRLRKAKGDGIRFYACGEYGDLNRRPHYHALLFNCHFDDRRHVANGPSGDKYYDSAELRRIWGNGNVHVAEVNWKTISYVARYVMKKITGPLADDYYDVVNADGELHRRLAEFTVMSRRPGIGTGWFEKYGDHAYKSDSVLVNAKPVSPPKFYDDKLKSVDPDRMEMLKVLRRRKARANAEENLIDRRRVKERLLYDRASKQKRVI